MVTQTLSADKGYIAELTVDQLDTSDKVRNYLNSDTSDVNYIRIYDQYIEFITATTDGLETEQLTNRDGDLVYWKDENKDVISYEDTGIPVIVYVYEELTKMSMQFITDPESGEYLPVLALGAGDGVTPLTGKGFLRKNVDGIELTYFKRTTGEKIKFALTDDGVVMDYDGNFLSNGVARNIHVSDTPPILSDGEVGDVFLETGMPEISDEDGAELVGGGDTALHTHDDRYYTEAEINGILNSMEAYVMTYTHNQSTPSDTWNINHGLTKFPSVTVVDSSGNKVVGDVKYTDNNNLVLTFNGAFSGKAYLN
jgi:hypothetical protein